MIAQVALDELEQLVLALGEHLISPPLTMREARRDGRCSI